MSKKRKDYSVSGDSAPGNPFAALAGLKPDLPEGPPETSSAIESPNPPSTLGKKLVVSRERKGRGGKTATVIRGFDASVNLADLSASMRKSLGTSGAVEGDAIVLGGDICQRAADWLEKNGATKVVIGN